MGPEWKFIDSGSSNKVEGGNKGDILVLGVPLGTPILLRGAIRVLGPGFGGSHLTGGGHLIDQPEVIEKIFTHLGLWPSFSYAPPSSAVALFFTFFNHLAASVRNRAAVGVAEEAAAGAVSRRLSDQPYGGTTCKNGTPRLSCHDTQRGLHCASRV